MKWSLYTSRISHNFLFCLSSISQNSFSWLQTTRETAVNTFRGCLARKNYATWELPPHFILFSFFPRKSLWYRNFTISVRNGSKRETGEICLVKWINFYTRFIFRIFLCCGHILQTSWELSVASFWRFIQKSPFFAKQHETWNARNLYHGPPLQKILYTLVAFHVSRPFCGCFMISV